MFGILSDVDDYKMIEGDTNKETQIPLILGGLQGWLRDDENSTNSLYQKDKKSAGMIYLQPYYDKNLDNYWISFSSANKTGGRICRIFIISQPTLQAS